MSGKTDRVSSSRHPKARAIGIFLLIVLVGPIIGWLLAAFGIVLAPPWTSLTGGLYVLVACLGLPIGLVAVWIKWISVRGLVVALIVGGMLLVAYLVILGPWLPGGMTDCQAMAAPLPQVRYVCVSTSSDDPDYRHEYRLEGRAGWPVMRAVDSREERP